MKCSIFTILMINTYKLRMSPLLSYHKKLNIYITKRYITKSYASKNYWWLSEVFKTCVKVSGSICDRVENNINVRLSFYNVIYAGHLSTYMFIKVDSVGCYRDKTFHLVYNVEVWIRIWFISIMLAELSLEVIAM